MACSRAMIWLVLVGLVGCGGKTPTEPTPPPETPEIGEDGGGETTRLTAGEAEAACLAEHCADAGGAECAACAHEPETWAVLPRALRFAPADETMFVEVQLVHTPGHYGAVEYVRDTPAWVGVTAMTSEGEEIDLVVQTVFPESVDAPITFSSDVGPDVHEVIVGLWGTKIEPCDVDRMGCRHFGFVLDQSLASWPPSFYTDGRRQRLPPAEVGLGVVGTGADDATLARVRELAATALRTELEVFGGAVGEGAETTVDALPDGGGVHVLFADAGDFLLARGLAKALRAGLDGVEVQVVHRDGIGAAFLVVVGGS